MCICLTAKSQIAHDQDINPGDFFGSGNPFTEFAPTKNFHAATFGLGGGHLFLGGSNGEKGMTWNAMQSNSTGYRFMSGRSAAQMDYSHWNNLWRLKFSSNSAASGNQVNWRTGLQVQLTSSNNI